MRIYISASWKNRLTVRSLAESLRKYGYEVFDFTDPANRKTFEAPPETYPERFDPSAHNYGRFLDRKEWRDAVNENRDEIKKADLIILLLPCGIDATADWALGVGMGKHSIIVGRPDDGERSEVHLWADDMLDGIEDIIPWLDSHELS